MSRPDILFPLFAELTALSGIGAKEKAARALGLTILSEDEWLTLIG